MATPTKYLRMGTITDIYDCSDRAIRYWVKAGTFPPPQKINGRNVWTEDEIAEHQAQVIQENWGGQHAFTKTPVTPSTTSQQIDYGSQAIKPALTEPSET